MTATLRAEAFHAMQTGRAGKIPLHAIGLTIWVYHTEAGKLATLLVDADGTDCYQVHESTATMLQYLDDKAKEKSHDLRN